jgi:hypothetical protein
MMRASLPGRAHWEYKFQCQNYSENKTIVTEGGEAMRRIIVVNYKL